MEAIKTKSCKVCNEVKDITNLQPLWASENLSKGCKYIDGNI